MKLQYLFIFSSLLSLSLAQEHVIKSSVQRDLKKDKEKKNTGKENKSTPSPSKSPTASPSSSPSQKAVSYARSSTGTCVDRKIGWHDRDGPTYNCAWYAIDDRCRKFGDQYPNFGFTANEACCSCGRINSEVIVTTSPPTRAPTSSPTISPTNFPTRAPTKAPTSAPTMSPSPAPTSIQNQGQYESLDQCIDIIEGWHDKDGQTYTCSWYGQQDNCKKFGDSYSNMGYTANENCCSCGGGKAIKSTSSPTSAPSKSQDQTSSESCTDTVLGWHDADHSMYDCEWYSQGSNCDVYGNSAPNYGFTAKQACCSCDGGIKSTNQPIAPTTPKVDTGGICSNNGDCESNFCNTNTGTCMPNASCKSLDSRFPKGTRYDENTIVLVFVGSDFTDKTQFASKAEDVYDQMQNSEMFSDPSVKLRSFYVDKLKGGFCEYGCNGIDRLLCCDIPTAREMANNCFPARSTLQTIVIHNDNTYGGAGYANENMAVISTNAVGPKLAVHELGHSLFELGDEYSYTEIATAETKANCDVEGCPKWADLDEYVGGGLCVKRGCKGNGYFVGRSSFMRNMHLPVGLVNLRYTCCTYKAFTKEFPAYCNQFEPVGNGLLNYCLNDYQGYGTETYLDNRRLINKNANNELKTSKHHVIKTPVVIDLNLEAETYHVNDITSENIHLFRKHQVQGDFKDMESAKSSRIGHVYTVEVHYETVPSDEFIFAESTPVRVPQTHSSQSNFDDTDYEHKIGLATRKTTQLVIDGSLGKVSDVVIRNVKL
ncbi:hypothetical protein CTEN210_09290 [Chaetoceros tenuissimus]|uniref:Uncharacterized protein n=1 Tax=Chaetoceros tenuissimus TaxID=426638 RepID=A0AAD3CYA7_9STRA|nr:hypothetical protein CTEN210_09290 [Chaetoceros tenuissimus]